MNNEYVEIYSFGSGGLVKKLATVDNKEIPDTYFGFKSTTSSEILYVSFSIVPSVAPSDAYMLVGVNSNEDIKSDLNVRKLIEDGISSNFTYVSDESFTITFTNKGTFTYEKLGLDTPIRYETEIESNKQTAIDVMEYTEPVSIIPTAGKTAMNEATVTLNNIPQIESNKQVTIDQWTYSEPVEVNPAQGKDAIDRVTVIISNPVIKLYCWQNINNTSQFIYTLNESPDTAIGIQSGSSRSTMDIRGMVRFPGTDDITVRSYESESQYTRYPSKDITLVQQAEVVPDWWDGTPPSGIKIWVKDIATGLTWRLEPNGSKTMANLNNAAATAKGAVAGTLILTGNDPINYVCNNVVN